MKTATRKHSEDCRAAYGRKDPTCPRCIDLMAGEAPIYQRRALHRRAAQGLYITRDYCFCAETSLAARICGKCGKKPYTD